ncbi:hypothetical protein G3A_00995 [Bacillus sp. 17376]|nr:hypothetical protein G3A_00995 [Bacillus sp. 17376]
MEGDPFNLDHLRISPKIQVSKTDIDGKAL